VTTAPPFPIPRRGRLEAALFVAQRTSALVMAPLVLLHLGVIFYAIQGGLSAAEILGRTRSNPAWPAAYGLLAVAAAVHGGIGLRTLAREGLGWRRLAGLAGGLFAVLALLLSLRALMVLA
jgi:fumarate reductase subunit C